VAAIADLHGSPPALEPVLAQVERERPDAIVVGGELAAGPEPAETLEQLMGLQQARFVRSNADRATVNCTAFELGGSGQIFRAACGGY